MLLLVEAAVLGGANPLRIDTGAGQISLDLGPITLAASELEQLFAAVFQDPGATVGARPTSPRSSTSISARISDRTRSCAGPSSSA